MNIRHIKINGHEIAYDWHKGNPEKTGLFFLGGFGSDMTGTKASFLSQKALENDMPFLRFDYQGCGESSGEFKDSTLGDWIENALVLFDECGCRRRIIIGSSMGGWIGLILAKKREAQTKAYIGIAPAVDFTEDLVWKTLSKKQKEKTYQIKTVPNIPPNAPQISINLIQEARNHLVFPKGMKLNMPIEILHGEKDKTVPYRHSLKFMRRIDCPKMNLTLVKDGDHSLSTERDLGLLWEKVQE
ncbi:MAG: alpha/beta hydrolase [Alphaproteobacteria bacterium]|nr:alpha/beta hydrolase [Alphaproteobacteria bacterium]